MKNELKMGSFIAYLRIWEIPPVVFLPATDAILTITPPPSDSPFISSMAALVPFTTPFFKNDEYV